MALAALFVACSHARAAPPASPLVVVARPGTELGPALPHALWRMRLAGLSRYGFHTPASAAFELALPASGRRLDFSVGMKAGPDRASPVRFLVSELRGETWFPLFDETLADAEPVWHDHSVALAATTADERILRFATQGDLGEQAEGPIALWGALRLLGPGGSAAANAGTQIDARAPNILLFSLDTLGAAYLGANGHFPGTSPRLDAFIASAASFDRAIAQYPTTLPSHASLFSGLYPIHHGIASHNFSTFPSLVIELARAGYVTRGFTENAFVSADFGFAKGFDGYEEITGGKRNEFDGNAAATFERALFWLRGQGRAARFFLFVHTYEVHAPYAPRDAKAAAFARSLTPDDDRAIDAMRLLKHNRGIAPLEPRDLRRLLALYSAEIQTLDSLFGRFLDELAALGLAEDTLVIVTSDHGEQFGEWGKVSHGDTLHNRVLHVPLAFRLGDRFPARRHSEPVMLVDVMPSILELAALRSAPGLDGRSLVASIRGDDANRPPVRPAFSERHRHVDPCADPKHEDACRLVHVAVQTSRFKLVASPDPGNVRLYDLDADPLETRDVKALYPDEHARLRAWIEAYLDASRSSRAGTAGAGPSSAELEEPEEIGEAVRASLRALGYID